jgi:hypothetical protein
MSLELAEFPASEIRLGADSRSGVLFGLQSAIFAFLAYFAVR